MPSHSRARKIKTLTNDSGIPIDRKTKQLVFYECDVETVKQVALKSGENFSREGANQVFELGYRKRQSRAVLYCLTDRMRFQKRKIFGSNPFRKQLTYREIKHFFVFPANPNVFMLCVIDESNGKKLYEMFRCRPEDVNTICDLTFKASTDPQNLLRDVSPLRQISISSREYGTEPSPRSFIDSHENSMDNLQRPDKEYPAASYPDQSQTGSVTRTGQNGYSEDRPELYLNGYDPNNYRSISPTVSRPGNHTQPLRRPSSVGENKVKGVYSCYELVPPNNNNNNYRTIDNTVHDPDSPTHFKRPTVQNTIPIEYRNSDCDFDPTQHTNFRYPTTMSYDSTQQKAQHIPIQNKYSSSFKNNTTVNNHINNNKQTCFEPHATHSLRATNASRILIEREPGANKSLRKFASLQNVNWGDEVTYISYNPISGTTICDNGPMYMYITRYPSNPNLPNSDSDYGLCESPRAQASTEPNVYQDWYPIDNNLIHQQIFKS